VILFMVAGKHNLAEEAGNLFFFSFTISNFDVGCVVFFVIFLKQNIVKVRFLLISLDPSLLQGKVGMLFINMLFELRG
jgi:hypothetical protein